MLANMASATGDSFLRVVREGALGTTDSENGFITPADVTPGDGTFTVGHDNQRMVWFEYNSASTSTNRQRSWIIEFVAPVGHILQPGVYEASARSPYFTNVVPGMYIAANGDSLEGTGVFRIRHVQFGPGIQVQSFWATFEHHYDGGIPAIVGELRYNFTPAPAVDAPVQRFVRLREILEFDVTAPGDVEAQGLPDGATFIPIVGVWRFTWTPLPGSVGHHRIVFHTQTDDGQVDVTTLIQVVGETSLTLTDEDGSYHLLREADSSFGLFENRYASNSIVITARGREISDFWQLEFAAPSGHKLTVGAYEDAVRPIFALPAQSSLDISGNYSGCYELNGAFTIRQLEYGPNDRIRSLRAAFFQRCVGSTGFITGELRFNFDPILPTNRPPEIDCPKGIVECPSPSGDVCDLRLRIVDPEGDALRITTEIADRSPVTFFIRATGSSQAFFETYSDVYPLGVHLVKFIISDSARNTNICYTTVHCIPDTEAPSLVCPPDIRTVNTPGRCSARVHLEPPAPIDTCEFPTVTGVRSDGRALDAPYPLGMTAMYWTASDSFGNNTNCIQWIQVDDAEPPHVICERVKGSRLFEPNFFLARAIDNCGFGRAVFVKDSARNITSGPFPSSTYLRFVRAQSPSPSVRSHGPRVFSLALKGDALVFADDLMGRRSSIVRLRLQPERRFPAVFR